MIITCLTARIKQPLMFSLCHKPPHFHGNGCLTVCLNGITTGERVWCLGWSLWKLYSTSFIRMFLTILYVFACCRSRKLWHCLPSPTLTLYLCHDHPLNVSVLFVLVCAGRLAPVALGCTIILMFPTNCSYHDVSWNSDNRHLQYIIFFVKNAYWYLRFYGSDLETLCHLECDV